MKKSYWIIAIVVVVLVLGYFGRHKIRTMLSGSSTAAPVQTAESVPTMTPSSAPSATMIDNAIVTTKTDPAKGAYLADTKGMTLYTYDKDTSGVSNCSGSCAKAWPPYTGKAPATMPADFTQIKRADGTMQFAFKGMPLYYYATDVKIGDITGDGVGDVWHIVKP